MQENKALVTGGTGYIGSNLVLRLAQLGWTVDVVVRCNSSIPESWSLMTGINVYVHDGTTQGMINILQKSMPDVAFNLVALSKYDHGPADIESLITSNVLFPTQLLEAMKVHGIKKIVNVETFWQYADGIAAYRPSCLYAATKQAFKDLMYSYVTNSSFDVISLILYDVYGPNDPRAKLVNLIASHNYEGAELFLTPGGQSVVMVHIQDVISALIRAADLLFEGSGGVCKTYSVAGSEKYTLQTLVNAVVDRFGLRLKIIWGGVEYRKSEVMDPWISERLPGWAPEIRPVDGIGALVVGGAGKAL